jgi:hypothetical protein
MSSLNEITTDHLGNRMEVRGNCVTPPAPSLLQKASGQISKDDVNAFPPPRDIFFMVKSTEYIHRVVTAAFWRTFSHEGKISPGW